MALATMIPEIASWAWGRHQPPLGLGLEAVGDRSAACGFAAAVPAPADLRRRAVADQHRASR